MPPSPPAPLNKTFGRWSPVSVAVKLLAAKTGDESAYDELGSELEGQSCTSVFLVEECDMPSTRLGFLFRKFKKELAQALQEVDLRLVQEATRPPQSLFLWWTCSPALDSRARSRCVYAYSRSIRSACMAQYSYPWSANITLESVRQSLAAAKPAFPVYLDISENLLSDADIRDILLVVAELPVGSVVNAASNHLVFASASGENDVDSLKRILQRVRFLSMVGNNVDIAAKKPAFLQSLNAEELDRIVFMPEEYAMTQPLDGVVERSYDDRCRRAHATFYAWRRLTHF